MILFKKSMRFLKFLYPRKKARRNFAARFAHNAYFSLQLWQPEQEP